MSSAGAESQEGQDRAKRAAAEEALSLIQPGMVVGLGSGTTAAFFIDALAGRVRAGVNIIGVPTSKHSADQAASLGIPLSDLERNPVVEIDVDGADEIDSRLNVLKGGGGALLHEKIVALASRRFVVIADDSKLVAELRRTAIPVEVIAFGYAVTRDRIHALGGQCSIRGGQLSPFVTDSGNLILDVDCPPSSDLFRFVDKLKATTGVVDHGVFRHQAGLAIVGSPTGLVRRVAPRS
jgi:ribose 5-phosphate isomerase A